MSLTAWPLQQAVFAALSADVALQGLIGNPPRVFDEPPGDAALPYLLIGEGSEQDWGTTTEFGAEHALMIHVWSRKGGRKQARAILAAVYEVLHEASLALDGFHLVNLRFVLSQVLVEADALTYHGFARYRAVTEEN